MNCISDEWSMEDKILFEQAYSSHGKSFKRIQQTVSKTMYCSVWENYNEQMDKSVETLRMVKLEVPYKLCFTVGKVSLKNDDTVHFFTNFSKTSQLLWILLGVCTAVMNSIIISLFVKTVVVISWLLCLIVFIRNKVSEFVPPWWSGGMDDVLLWSKLGLILAGTL